MRIAFEVIVAAMAVFGLYFCIKVVAGWIFADKSIGAAVIIENKKQLDNLDILISEASESLFYVRKRKIAVFVPKIIWDGCETSKKAEVISLCFDYGVKLYDLIPYEMVP